MNAALTETLEPLVFPLHGSRLIEASAGTGKTWTIAALYLRLVLGHGGDHAFARPLLPSEILVTTFTRAATRELSNRVRERLVQAAAFFRGEREADEPYVQALSDSYSDDARSAAAYRLQLAAETMDEAAIFTIDAWCQRMLREHAFDSGSLFDEELVSDEMALFEDAAHDYWRQHVYPLERAALGTLLAHWPDVTVLKKAVRDLLRHAEHLDADLEESLTALIRRAEGAHIAALAVLKEGWVERADAMEQWIVKERAANPDAFHMSWLKPESVTAWCEAVRTWAVTPAQHQPALTEAGWNRLTPKGLKGTFKGKYSAEIPPCFHHTRQLQADLAALDQPAYAITRHATLHIRARMGALKAAKRQFGFADMLDRLKTALEGENGAALRARITAQYPIAMVDEFQDTSPDQYRLFDLLYDIGANDPAHGLFLIGDPKQSIYGFRGADIHSYLAARTATAGRHYQLGTNYRSTTALVAAVNRLFLHAEGHGAHPGYVAGAFRFRQGDVNPLPFTEVAARGRSTHLVGVDGPYQALAVALASDANLAADDHRDFFAQHCAEHIVGLLNDPRVGFTDGATFTRLVPADIAILVRNRKEAAAVRTALARRSVPSVYLSDSDSVVDSDEARDVLRWLRAVANPLDGALARAAFATRTAGLPLAELATLTLDESAWENVVEQLKALHVTWQRQGVLAMLRRLVHELKLPVRLMAESGGERRLTNLLHVAELLQSASREVEGEQALIRWFAEQMAGLGEGSDERVLRLESDADLVKVVTVHKSKGLEYPLVYLPYAASTRKTNRATSSFFDYMDENGKRQIDLGMSETAKLAAEDARLDEDLRLLYVALTRAAHFLWVGASAVATGKNGKNQLHESALGYLLTGGVEVPGHDLRTHWDALRGELAAIDVHELPAPDGCTLLDRAVVLPDLAHAPRFTGQFERDWSVGSFTSIARHATAPPMRPQEETTREEDPPQPPGKTEDAPWHRFPRGSVPGNFLHDQLEWLAGEGFACINDPATETRLAQRIVRAGWGHRLDDALDWLRAVVNTALPPVGAALAGITEMLPEMEFWFPTERLDVGALDRLCRTHLLDGVSRPILSPRALHGMLKGFADLVFEHEGTYWVLDYKSNALGAGDAAYTKSAMAAGMAAHRYDIQGAIYMLALHRLLRSRLGDAYDPAEQLGGAVFLFLRGVANPATHGCYQIAPDMALLDGLDALLDEVAA